MCALVVFIQNTSARSKWHVE